jgi:hypothetical protein
MPVAIVFTTYIAVSKYIMFSTAGKYRLVSKLSKLLVVESGIFALEIFSEHA